MSIRAFISLIKKCNTLPIRATLSYLLLSGITLLILFALYGGNKEYFTERVNDYKYHLVVIGGASEHIHKTCLYVVSSRIVTSSFSYFQWHHKNIIQKYIQTLPQEQKIIILGHSWGGQTAAQICEKMPQRIKLLITLDPVGWKDNFYFPKKSVRWINVIPQANNFSLNNMIATLGHRWKNRQEAENININCDHCSIDKMLDAKSQSGKTLEEIIINLLKK